jgi:hypothetical protein
MHRLTSKNRGKDVCDFARQCKITYIKKEKFRSAEGLYSKELGATLIKSA